MNLFELKRLWTACAVLSAIVLLVQWPACESSTEAARPTLLTMPPALLPVPPPAISSYTFVGPARPFDGNAADSSAATASATAQSPAESAPTRIKPGGPATGATTADTTLALGRQTPTLPQLGAVPDLDLRLAGVELSRVMAHLGYVPAIKTRTRLLGKILGAQFVPMTAAERARYARRGRAGADHPDAERWLQRVAAELRLPRAELEFIFLVPLATEQIFIAAEMAALQRAGKSPQDIALVRAHFTADLAIVVDVLLSKTGEVVPVDSVRVP